MGEGDSGRLTVHRENVTINRKGTVFGTVQGVADLLSKFDFNIISEGPGDFSTQHRKYTCEFSKPGIESFTTTYQSNPDVHGQPTATDVFAALASDALAVDGRHIDDFADEMGFEKPSQAIRAYESCRKTLDWLKNDMQLMTSEISDIAETLDNELDEVKEEVERVQAERKAKHEFEHPPVPEGFTYVSGVPYEVPADVLNGLKDAVRISDRAATIEPSASLTIDGWNQKLDDSLWALDFEDRNGVPPQLSDWLARDAEGEKGNESAKTSPVSLKTAAEEAHAVSTMLSKKNGGTDEQDGKDDLQRHMIPSEMRIPSQNDHHRAPSLSDIAAETRAASAAMETNIASRIDRERDAR